MSLCKMARPSAALVFTFGVLPAAQAQVSITTLGLPTTENFDGMGVVAAATVPPGFKVYNLAAGAGQFDWTAGNTATTQRGGTLTAATAGGSYNWAAGDPTSAADRALGYLTSGNADWVGTRSIVYAFTNNTGATINELDVAFDYEKYRSGTRAFGWTFFHGSNVAPTTAETDGDQAYAADAGNTVVNPATTISKAFTIDGLAIAPGETYYLRWTLAGNGGTTNAQGLGIDNFSLTADVTGDAAPGVASHDPGDGETGVALDSNIEITFSEDVDVTGAWFAISCEDSGAHTAVVSGGPLTYTLDPDVDFGSDESCTVTIESTLVTDADNDDPPDSMDVDYDFTFTTLNTSPVLTVNDVSVFEGDTGTTNAVFTVTLTNDAPAAFTVDYSVGGGSADESDYDTSATGTLNFAGNDGESQQISILVNGDGTTEPDETFSVALSNITGGAVSFAPGGNEGIGTILNDDADIVTIAQIQGSGATSPFDPDTSCPANVCAPGAQQVKVTGGIVTAITLVAAEDGTPADANGFFMQTADAEVDGNDLTSEGIFVFTGVAPTVAVGDVVTVVGQVTEYFNFTQISDVVVVRIDGSVAVPAGLPTAVEFSTASGIPSRDPAALSCPGTGPGGANNVDTNFECFEGMRVTMPEADITRANQRRAADVYAEAFFSPLGTGSHREIGLTFPLVPGAGNPDAPQWDGEPEVFEIDGDEAGLPLTELTVGSRFSATGVIGYSFGDYEFYPTQFTAIDTVPVPDGVVAAGGNQLTVGSFNAQHLCDSTASTPNCNRDTPGAGGTTLDYPNKRIKVAAYICDVLGAPDVLGLQEVDRLSTLVDLETDVFNECGVNYDSFLQEGDDPGDIDVGFMVNTARVSVTSVTQFFKGATWPDPNGTDTLHDRPPLLLRGTFLAPMGNREIAVLNNHTKAFPNPDDEGAAAQRDRAKRFWQAEQIATLVQEFQTATGTFAGQGTDTVPLILVGDYNAYEHTDGRVDVVGLIAGNYDNARNTCNAVLSNGQGTETCDLDDGNIVVPPLFNTAFAVPEAQRRSYLFTPNFGVVQGFNTRDMPAGQVIDHILLARTAQGFYLDTQYGNASTGGADENWRTNAGPLRASDHDGLVAHLDFDCLNSATLNPDNDTVCGILDNCPNAANDDQADGDADGIGDECDVNNPPVAVNDTVAVAEGGTATTVNGAATSVTGNDTDAEDGIPGGTVTLGTGPANASAFALNADGTFSYTHDGSETLADSFTYTVTDSAGAASGTATVAITITAVNDAPTISNVADTSVAEDGNVSVDFTIADIDSAVTCADVTGTSGTPAVIANAGIVVSGAAQACSATLTPVADANGTSTILLTVTDGQAPASDSFVLTVTPVNDTPSFVVAANNNSLEDAGAQSVPGFASSISAGAPNEAGQVLTFDITGNTNPALFSVQPSISANGTLAYTSAPDANGQATITVTLSDDAGATSAPQTFTITVTTSQDAPVFTNEPYAFSVAAQSPAGTQVGAVSASDADGNALTFSINTSSNPGAVTIDPQTGVITVADPALLTQASSPLLLTVRVTDGNGGQDLANVTITVTAALPERIFADGFEGNDD